MKVGGEFNPRPNSLMFNHKDKDFMREIDVLITEMKINGKIQELKEKWWYKTLPKRKCYEHRKLYNGLTMENAGGMFAVIAAGVVLTVISLWLENWYYDLRARWDLRNSRSTASILVPGVPVIKRKNTKCTLI